MKICPKCGSEISGEVSNHINHLEYICDECGYDWNEDKEGKCISSGSFQ